MAEVPRLVRLHHRGATLEGTHALQAARGDSLDLDTAIRRLTDLAASASHPSIARSAGEPPEQQLVTFDGAHRDLMLIADWFDTHPQLLPLISLPGAVLDDMVTTTPLQAWDHWCATNGRDPEDEHRGLSRSVLERLPHRIAQARLEPLRISLRRTAEDPHPFLTAAELEHLRSRGWMVALQGYWGHDLTLLKLHELEAELKQTIEVADRHGAQRFLVWPHGRWSLMTDAAADDMGFTHRFTLDGHSPVAPPNRHITHRVRWRGIMI